MIIIIDLEYYSILASTHYRGKNVDILPCIHISAAIFSSSIFNIPSHLILDCYAVFIVLYSNLSSSIFCFSCSNLISRFSFRDDNMVRKKKATGWSYLDKIFAAIRISSFTYNCRYRQLADCK